MGDSVQAELLDRARSLVPLLQQHARASEIARHPADAVVAALREAGVFELMVPRSYGGLELDLDSFLELGLELAAGDASAAWVTCFYIEHNWMLCQFPESFQSQLFQDRTHVLAPASIAPNGIAEPVGDSFRISGRWQWATGIWHGEWVIVGARVESSAPVPDLRFFAVPRAECELIDTWFVDGLCATGSHDIELTNVLVPEERVVSMADMANGCAHGARLHSGPLYRTPMIPILGLAASLPAVGVARAAVQELLQELPTRGTYLGGQARVDRTSIQMRLARADLQVRQSEGLLREIVRELCEVRERATSKDRARWLAAAAMAVAQSREALHSLADTAGATSHFLSSPVQRSVRGCECDCQPHDFRSRHASGKLRVAACWDWVRCPPF